MSSEPNLSLTKKGKEEIKKHVGAIHTSGDLSHLARKVSNVLLYQAYDDLLTKQQHSIPIKLLAKLVGWDHAKDHEKIKDAVRELNATRIEFNLMEDGEEVWETTSLIASARIRKRSGIVEWEYTRQMAARLYEPAMYARINLGIQRDIGSGYALALYENIVRFRNVKHTGDWEIEKIRQLLGATAPTYDEYKRFSAFVLKPSIEQINKSTDIQVSPIYKKNGRRIVAINFEIADNPQRTLPNSQSDGVEHLKAQPEYKKLIEEGANERLAIVETAILQPPAVALLEPVNLEHLAITIRLEALGLGEVDARDMIERYGVTRVLAVVEHVEAEDRLGKVKNTGALIITILKRKGVVGKPPQQQRHDEAKKREMQERQQTLRNADTAIEKERQESQALWQEFLTYTDEKQRVYIDAVTSADRFALASYGKTGLESAVVRNLICIALRKERKTQQDTAKE
jgi:hypothetical protein